MDDPRVPPGISTRCRPLAEDTGVLTYRLTILCPEPLPQVLADSHRIEQVINNRLTNVMKYAQPGTDITVRLRQEKNEVIISV